jgi:electron transfer flavoprotein alpha subunit
MSVAAGAGGSAERKMETDKQAFLVPLEFEYDPEADELSRALRAAHEEAGVKSIADAEFIIDVGYALRNKENFDAVIMPLKKRLEEIGVKNVVLGGTRKVVEELKLLGSEQQIGQTGTAVNPKLIISIGVSGAPQHVDYIGERATIIAFNKDADAPLMTLNRRRPRPKVVPIVGDLFETVPRFIAALKA